MYRHGKDGLRLRALGSWDRLAFAQMKEELLLLRGTGRHMTYWAMEMRRNTLT